MGDIPATYEITPEPERPPPPPPPGASAGQMALIIGAIGLTLAVALAALAGLLHARGGVSSSQAAQIRALNSDNTRLAAGLAAEGSELTQMSARLAAADPAADGSLITCADLRRMGLMATTGGSVSAVPGPVSLSQGRVPLPAHCARS